MSEKKICFIAQFPPPIHGLSKAVETLYNSYLANEFEFEKVDIKDNKKFFLNLIKIAKSKADLFYFTISQTKGGNLRDLIILKLLKLQKKKCLIHLHGGYYRKLVDNDLGAWQRKANYNAISKVDGVIVLSKSLRSIFKDMLPEEKIHTVANCVDDEFLISDEEFNKKLEGQKNKKIKNILYLSNFIKEKGYPEVLALAKLEKERCNTGGERKLHFDFAGKFFKEEDRKYFFDYIKNNQLEDYVTYHGIVSGEAKRSLLKNSDIFVLLTRYPNEGQPISILEAMGNGMMIVTTNHAGIPDIVEDGVNGIVSHDINVDEIYNRVLKEYTDKVMNVNRETVMNKYRENIYLDNMKAVFCKK